MGGKTTKIASLNNPRSPQSLADRDTLSKYSLIGIALNSLRV
jgi:hypothetical protein